MTAEADPAGTLWMKPVASAASREGSTRLL
jgi:hypothetical protein